MSTNESDTRGTQGERPSRLKATSTSYSIIAQRCRAVNGIDARTRLQIVSASFTAVLALSQSILGSASPLLLSFGQQRGFVGDRTPVAPLRRRRNAKSWEAFLSLLFPARLSPRRLCTGGRAWTKTPPEGQPRREKLTDDASATPCQLAAIVARRGMQVNAPGRQRLGEYPPPVRAFPFEASCGRIDFQTRAQPGRGDLQVEGRE